MSGKKQPSSSSLEEGIVTDRITDWIVYTTTLNILFHCLLNSLFCIHLCSGDRKGIFFPIRLLLTLNERYLNAQPTATTQKY